MTRLTLAGLALVVLAGCDMVNAPDQVTDYTKDYLPESVSGRTVCAYNVKPPEWVYEVDSLSFCPYSDSGTYYPNLIQTTWIGTNSACQTMNEPDVIGGIKGIKRHFGCYKRPPAYPVAPKVECVDCGWSK